MCVCAGGGRSSVIHPNDLLWVPMAPSASTALFCLLICIKHASAHSAISLPHRSFNLKKAAELNFLAVSAVFFLFPLLFGAGMIARTFPLLHLRERYSVQITSFKANLQVFHQLD